MKNQAFQAALDAFEHEIQSLTLTSQFLSLESFSKAVDILCGAPRVATSGCGHSGIACAHFAHSLCCVERPARFLSPAEAVHGGMGFVQKGDALVVASRGGMTDELMPIIDISREKGALVIGITENSDSLLAKKSDVVLLMKITREADKFNSQSTSSFVALAALFDALQAAIIEETNYQNDQFLLIHPGGAVGKRLKEEIGTRTK